MHATSPPTPAPAPDPWVADGLSHWDAVGFLLENAPREGVSAGEGAQVRWRAIHTPGTLYNARATTTRDLWLYPGEGLRPITARRVRSAELPDMVSMIQHLTATGLLDDRHAFLLWLTARRYLWGSRTVRKALGVPQTNAMDLSGKVHFLPAHKTLVFSAYGLVEPHPLAWSRTVVRKVHATRPDLGAVWPDLTSAGVFEDWPRPQGPDRSRRRRLHP